MSKLGLQTAPYALCLLNLITVPGCFSPDSEKLSQDPLADTVGSSGGEQSTGEVDDTPWDPSSTGGTTTPGPLPEGSTSSDPGTTGMTPEGSTSDATGDGSSTTTSSTGEICSDADLDGICDDDDVCPGGDDAVDIDLDDVPDCSQNLLLNAEFDDDISPWGVEGLATLAWDDSDDALGDPHSGMAVVDNIAAMAGFVRGGTQCVQVAENTAYEAFVQLFIPLGQGSGTGGVNVSFYGDDNCGGFLGNPGSSTTEAPGFWTSESIAFVTPSGTHSLRFRLRTQVMDDAPGFSVAFDNPLLRLQ